MRSAAVAAASTLAALVLVLLLPGGLILASYDTDIIQQFAASRAFAAQTIAAGHLPLWNPYTYGGQPFLGGFESAVLYPPNLIFLLLPLARALNFSLLFHLILMGWGMERWAARRGLSDGAAALAGWILPLSGAVFPHVYAGHLSNLSTMAWAPWLFLGLEKWTWGRDARGLLLASAAVCLQILSGQIQYVFFIAVAAGLQAVVISIAEPAVRRRALPGVVGTYLAGAMLSAVQLLPGLAAESEGIRQQKLEHDFAAMFGFPPENFLTLISPGFFGGPGAYWGRAYFWEMSLFIGVAGLPLIAVACAHPRWRRRAWGELGVVAVLLVLAMGVHTPLFDLLYFHAPAFANFRGWSKFTFPATLFLIMTVATGADLVLRGEGKFPCIACGTVIAGVMATAFGVRLFEDPHSIRALFNPASPIHEVYLAPSAFNLAFGYHAGRDAGASLALGGVILIVAGALLLARKRRWAIPAVIVLEMFAFANGQMTFSRLSDAMPAELTSFIAAHPGDYRVLNHDRPNNGFLLGAGDLWGNNPFVLRRYAEFMAMTQGQNPNRVNQDLAIDQLSPLFSLLRFRYAFAATGAIVSPVPPLPHVLLVSQAGILASRNAIFTALRDPQFDPAKTVFLESTPDPAPQAAASGTATLISQRPDELIIDAVTDKPAILLITDPYATGWRAEPLAASAQQIYHLMPADYILRAVPLQAGHHHLRVFYSPFSFPIGVVMSITSWAVWLGLLPFVFRMKTMTYF